MFNLYNANRTDVVDLGLSVLWCTSNATDEQFIFSDCDKYKAANDKGYRLPTKDEYDKLLAVTPSDGWTTENGTNGWKFSNDYG